MASNERDAPREGALLADGDSFMLSDLLNHVFDKGVVITGSVVIGIADIDLVHLDLDIVIGSAESALLRARERAEAELADQATSDADLPVLPPGRGD